MLADFGLALKTSVDDLNNPVWYNNDSGTEGFLAPEQRRWVDGQSLQPIDEWRLNAKTNVYGVGMILWCLVTLQMNGEQPIWLGVGEDDETVRQLPNEYPADQYSDELRSLIEECLWFPPYARPTFQNMLNTIRQHTGPGAGDLSLGMRNGGAVGAIAAAQHIQWPQDRYRLGLHRDAIV